MLTRQRLIAGSRESTLALTQTQLVLDALQAHYPNLETELKTYKTQGDINLETALSEIGDKGLFVKELEHALLEGKIDFAVHSMKDMPSEQPEGLTLIPFGKREVPLDALVCSKAQSFSTLPAGAVVGTSSLRRQAILKSLRPDLNYQVVRGNLQTRLKKLDTGHYDALVLAYAGLHRLKLDDRVCETFPPEVMLPACCQGTLGIEVSEKDVLELFSIFVDNDTLVCTQAERWLLKTLQGGCQVPLAGYAKRLNSEAFHLFGLLSNLEGTQIIRAEARFMPGQERQAAEKVASELLQQGGETILKNIQRRS